MKPFRERIKKLNLDPFPTRLYIVASTDPQKSRIKRSNILGHYDWAPDTVALHSTDGPISYIFIENGADIGDITHEIYHVVHRLMEYIGAKHENEVMAYFMGYLVREAALHVYATPTRAKKKGKHVKSK